MGYKITEAIIENGQIKYTNKKLPTEKLKVHLIYDVPEQIVLDDNMLKIIEETCGIYKDIDAESEVNKLRASWERNVC